MGISTIMENLEHPPMEFTPIPFWFYNDAPDKDKIKKQGCQWHRAASKNRYSQEPEISFRRILSCGEIYCGNGCQSEHESRAL